MFTESKCIGVLFSCCCTLVLITLATEYLSGQSFADLRLKKHFVLDLNSKFMGEMYVYIEDTSMLENDNVTTKGREKGTIEGQYRERQISQMVKDCNHPGHLVPVLLFQRFFDQLEEEEREKFPECKSIDPSLRPPEVTATDGSIFDYVFQEWWSIFTHCKSEMIKDLKELTQKLTNVFTIEEMAALMARLTYELSKMVTSGTIHNNNVAVKQSDEESVIIALQAWGLNDEKLLNTSRAVYRTWDEGWYSNDTDLWPRNCSSFVAPFE